MTIGRLRGTRLPANERMPRSAPRVRLAVAVAVAAAIPFAAGLSREERLGLSALVVGYAVVSAVLDVVGRRRPQIPARGLTAAAGLVAVFGATLLLPSLQGAALVIYALTITAYTCIGGRDLGLALTAAAIPAALAAAFLSPTDDRLRGWTLALFVVALPVLALAADALTLGRRRTAARLAQLHDALRAVTVTPDLQATLDSIADSATTAVEAVSAAVFLRKGRTLVAASVRGVPDVWDDERALGDASPLTRAATHLERVVVDDLANDERFPEWRRTRGAVKRAAGVVGLAAVPIRLGGDVIGVLSAGFSRDEGPGREEVALLATYAEQAALVIVRAQAYERERQAAEELADADRRKAEFLGIVSHELRTPLTVVKGFVDTVLLHWDRLPDDRRRDLLAKASGNADDLDRLVGQLLDFARIEADRVKLDAQPVATRVIVDEVVSSLAPTLSAHRVDIAVPASLAVTADETAVRQVLASLLTNAAKFSPSGSRIGVSARPADNEVVISVADEGPGVAREDRDRVFERFYQSPETDPARRGAGIGLTIAKRFTELHGGRIWVERGRTGGATFSFSLPAAAPVATSAQPVGAWS
ncbi:MAG: ATP-binding protein [Acidimicrobiia bacterium]